MYLLRHVEDTNTTDRERLLHSLVIGLTTNIPPSANAPHVAYGQEPRVGDLVIGLTSKQIGHVVELPKLGARDAYGWQIRPLGLDKVEQWDNESFTPIRGVRSEDMLCGAQYKFWREIVRGCDELEVKGVTPPRSMHKAIARPLTVTFEGDAALVVFRLKFGDRERAVIRIEPWASTPVAEPYAGKYASDERSAEVRALRETCARLLREAGFSAEGA